MANWEEEVFRKCHKNPFHYLSYLDDILGIWIGSKMEFQEFVYILNSHDPSIQLKMETDQHSVEFLYTTVYRGPDFEETHKLDIKDVFKTTDTHALLNKTSVHLRHMFLGIVKSQILRFRIIYMCEETFMEHTSLRFILKSQVLHRLHRCRD